MRVIFTGGGTAGHINPAIAIADALAKLDENAEILFIGTRSGLENRLCQEAGYPLWHIDAMGIKRSLSFDNVKAVFKAVKAVNKAKKMLDTFKPDAVLGTGGYICYPVVRAAASMGVFTALHESNAIPGMAVKMLKNKVDRIYVNFDECKRLLGGGEKIVRSGNPVKNTPINRGYAREQLGITGCYRYVLLSFGGSLGAETVNREVLTLMQNFSSKRKDIFHLHATGKVGYGEFCRRFSEMGLNECKNISVKEYIYDMPKWLTAADLVISRSGAMTLSEIAYSGRASILIPSPNVVDDHQYKNAKAFSDAGAAFTLREGTDELSRLCELTETVLSDRAVRERMEAKAKDFNVPNAADMIARELLNIKNEKIRMERTF